MKDWTGNYQSVVGCLGTTNGSTKDREENDFYATDPIAAEWLMKLETLDKNIWECACGQGHLAKPLIRGGTTSRVQTLLIGVTEKAALIF